MSPIKIVAIVLIAGGILGLAYGSFSYVSDRHSLDLGVGEVAWNDTETVNVPVWAGVAGIVAGAALMFSRRTA